jgi:hypothetical protein
MLVDKPTTAEIRSYREAKACGINEAKAALTKRWQLDTLLMVRQIAKAEADPDGARLIEALCDVIQECV